MPSQPHDSPLFHRPLGSIGFIVNDRPIAVYGAGLRESTHEFIRTFSADSRVKQRRKPAKHQPIPELVKALAMPPEKRCKKTNKMATRGCGWAMGVRYIVYPDTSPNRS